MGNVGNAVMNNLLRANFAVDLIHDVVPSRCEQGRPASVAVADSPRHLAENVDIIITGLPKPHHVRDMFDGGAKDSGLIHGMSQGKTWIDHSTTDHEQNKFFKSELDKKGSHILECPITGGLEALKKGQMAVWVGGEKEAFEAVRPVLDASYSTVMYTGGLGTAMIPKVVSNLLCFLQLVAMGEVLMIAKKSGMELDTFWHSIRGSAGNSFLWETAGPNIFRGEYHDSFALELACKDNMLGFEMAKTAEVPIEIIGHMQQIYHRALYQLGPDVGCYAPPKLLEIALGESLQVDGFENWSYSVENVEGALHVRHHNIAVPQGVKGEADDNQDMDTEGYPWE